MIVILGGGLSGLQLGARLAERGLDFVMLEQREGVGGLCRSFKRGGHTWDLGPHGFYSKKPETMEYYRALPLKFHELERDVRVCHRDGERVYELGYPFENGLHELPVAHKLECVAGYCWAAWTGGGGPYANLRDWIDRGLGRGIARHFMLPYNRKIWSCSLDRISMELVSKKIEPEKPWTIMRNSVRGGSVGRAYQARFLYPKAGGAGAIPEAVAAKIKDKIVVDARVQKLTRGPRGWSLLCAGGKSFLADTVVSTIPIPELLDALGEPELSAQRPRFVYNDTLFITAALKPGRTFARFASCQWVFFAGPESFYRLSFTSAFAPGSPSAVVAEITHNGRGPAPAPDEAISRVLRDLKECGVLRDEGDVEFCDAHLERYTYPVQTLGLPEALGALEASLTPRGLHLLGRMGRWEYINTDGVFLGVDALLAGRGAALVRG